MSPGCAWQLTTFPATNVFPKHPLSWPYQQIKKPPHKPLTECASHFCECVNNFWLAGQTRRLGDVCAASLCVCPHLLIYSICLNIFTSFVLFFPLSFPYNAGKKMFMSFFHNLIRSYTQEGCYSMDLPDHVNEVPWLCSHWSIIDLFVSYLPNRHSDPEHVYFAMRYVKKDWKFPQRAH